MWVELREDKTGLHHCETCFDSHHKRPQTLLRKIGSHTAIDEGLAEHIVKKIEESEQEIEKTIELMKQIPLSTTIQ
jgi:hypothetical protein